MVGSEITRVGALLTDASALIIDVADMTTAWTEATLPGTVLSVLCEVVRRAFDNPAGLQSETIGDYTWRGKPSGESSSVYLTTDERRTVRRAAGRLGIGTVTLSSDLPLAPVDSRLLYPSLSNDDGYIIINAPEPTDA